MIDIQSSTTYSRFAIDAVGVINLQYPLMAQDSATGEQQMLAGQWQASVSLPQGQRGTHMSRFVEVLEESVGTPLDPEAHLRLAEDLRLRLGAESLSLATNFTWFRSIRAPVSGMASRQPLQLGLRSAVHGATLREKSVRLSVVAKALCPCSKAISERGAHNQRTDLSVRLFAAPAVVLPGYDELCELLESCASARVYPLLKRSDEKLVTETAYDNPMFVEDLVRGMAERCAELAGVGRFVVEAINRESIHAHDCFATIKSERPGYQGIKDNFHL